MPGTGGRKQFRVTVNTKSFTVYSMMISVIESRIKHHDMHPKSLSRIVFNSCRYSFDFNVNYLMENKVIRTYFLKNLSEMDLYDRHVLWLTIWDWPECFMEEGPLQDYLVEQTFIESIERIKDESKLSIMVVT